MLFVEVERLAAEQDSIIASPKSFAPNDEPEKVATQRVLTPVIGIPVNVPFTEYWANLIPTLGREIVNMTLPIPDN
jgi:hypothetical protein